MHFSSLILALAAATAASAATVSKRNFYFPTFLHLDGATEASDYLTYVLAPTVEGKALTLFFEQLLTRFQIVSPPATPSLGATSSTVSQFLVAEMYDAELLLAYHDVNGKVSFLPFSCSC